jgi:hypothetical protein|eukprot:SAG25_NODE_207_length_11874_cov_27.396773_4_plen_58_part_00
MVVPAAVLVLVQGGVDLGVGVATALRGRSHFQRCSRLWELACGDRPLASSGFCAHPR